MAHWGSFAITGALLAAIILLVSACSDDPILGPDDNLPEDDGGGSYSTIERLAPKDTGTVAPSVPAPDNPERF